MGVITSYDPLYNVRDVSAVFNKIQLPNTTLLNILPVGMSVSNTKHFWWDDVRVPIATTLGAAYTQSTAAGVLTVASSKGLRVNSLIKVAGQIKKVTAIGSDTSITTAHIGGSADADIANSTAVTFLANAQTEGKDYEDSDYTPKSERYNVTQIFNDFVKITGTEISVRNELGEDVYTDEVQRKMERIKLGMGRGLWVNPRVSPSDNTTPRIMGGIDYFLAQYGYCPAAASFSVDNFDAFILKMEQDYGAIPTEVWMNPTELSNFSAVDVARLYKNYDDKTIGRAVNAYVTKYGHVLKLFTDPQAPVKSIYCIDRSKIEIKPLNGRALAYGDLAKTGDNRKGQLVGEYTLEIRNSSTMGKFAIS